MRLLQTRLMKKLIPFGFCLKGCGWLDLIRRELARLYEEEFSMGSWAGRKYFGRGTDRWPLDHFSAPGGVRLLCQVPFWRGLLHSRCKSPSFSGIIRARTVTGVPCA